MLICTTGHFTYALIRTTGYLMITMSSTIRQCCLLCSVVDKLSCLLSHSEISDCCILWANYYVLLQDAIKYEFNKTLCFWCKRYNYNHKLVREQAKKVFQFLDDEHNVDPLEVSFEACKLPSLYLALIFICCYISLFYLQI